MSRVIRWMLLMAGIYLAVMGGYRFEADFDLGEFKLDLREEAVKDVATQAVKAIPENVHFRLLGVGDIKGDTDGRITEAVTEKVQENSHFVLVERQKLEAILKEVGIQVGDLVDEETRVTPGKIKAVEGILFGRVVADRIGLLSHKLTVHFNLDDVQSGEIKYSKTFKAEAVSKYRPVLLRLVGIVFLMLALALARSARKRTKIQKMDTAGEDVRRRLETEAVGALTKLDRVLVPVAQADDDDLATKAAQANRALNALSIKVKNLPVGPVSDKGKSALDKVAALKEFDQMYFVELRIINGLAGKVDEAAKSSKWAKAQSRLDELDAAIEKAANRLTQRPD